MINVQITSRAELCLEKNKNNTRVKSFKNVVIKNDPVFFLLQYW